MSGASIANDGRLGLMANVVYDKESTVNPLFKEVLDSQRAFARTVVPYWTRINGLYYNMAVDSGNAK